MKRITIIMIGMLGTQVANADQCCDVTKIQGWNKRGCELQTFTNRYHRSSSTTSDKACEANAELCADGYDLQIEGTAICNGKVYIEYECDNGDDHFNFLGTIDERSGKITEIGALTDDPDAIECACDGTLYGIVSDGSSSPSDLVTINKKTAQINRLKALKTYGVEDFDGEALTYDCSDGTLVRTISGTIGSRNVMKISKIAVSTSMHKRKLHEKKLCDVNDSNDFLNGEIKGIVSDGCGNYVVSGDDGQIGTIKTKKSVCTVEPSNPSIEFEYDNVEALNLYTGKRKTELCTCCSQEDKKMK
eukprot:210133_1